MYCQVVLVGCLTVFLELPFIKYPVLKETSGIPI